MINLKEKISIHNKKTCIILFLLITAIYLCNFKIHFGEGDSLVFRYLPYSILNRRSFNLDDFYKELITKYPFLIYVSSDGKDLPYYLLKKGGHYYSSKGVGPAILSLPLLFIPIKFFHLVAESSIIVFLSKLTASILIALSAVFIYRSVDLLRNKKTALLITFIYAFCSNMWSITSQNLLQQTGSEFFLSLAIYFLIKSLNEERVIPYVGFFLASAVVMRHTNFVILAIMTIYVIHLYKNRFWKFFFSAAFPILFVFSYNYYAHGSIFLFPQMVNNPSEALYKTGSTNLWSTPLLKGLLGVLFSPSRGLFVYSPIFIFSFIGMIALWIKREKIIFRYFSLSVIALVIIHSKWYDWWGGWTFGCRVLNDTIPFLSLFLIPIMDYLRKRRRAASIFILAIVISFYVQIIGAFFYNNEWNANPDIDLNQSRLWSWKNSQLSYYIHRILKNAK